MINVWKHRAIRMVYRYCNITLTINISIWTKTDGKRTNNIIISQGQIIVYYRPLVKRASVNMLPETRFHSSASGTAAGSVAQSRDWNTCLWEPAKKHYNCQTFSLRMSDSLTTISCNILPNTSIIECICISSIHPSSNSGMSFWILNQLTWNNKN